MDYHAWRAPFSGDGMPGVPLRRGFRPASDTGAFTAVRHIGDSEAFFRSRRMLSTKCHTCGWCEPVSAD